MPKEFHEGCLSLQYPDNWLLEREDTDHGWTISVSSPSTAFLTLTLDNEFPDADALAEAALEVMREEYHQFEADAASEQLAGQWAVGHDINFITLDLTNTCWTRSFDTPDGTVLLMCQATDSDMTQQEPVLRAILASLTVREED